MRQSAEVAEVDLRHVESGDTRQVVARWVVGCDGANSLVRRTIGGEPADRGFQADWLVVDVLLNAGVTIERLGLPAAGQYCNPLRPTTIVPGGVRDGRTYRRWEFMRMPGESVSLLEDEQKVWELLRPWVGPDDIELVRFKVYNFRSLLAADWRKGRLLVAGDAAHLMPPFMGQGMCSGLRDAWNLAWKFDMILDGKADGRLLDTYDPERKPHVSQIIDMSIYLGRIICVQDLDAAKIRDEAFLCGAGEPMAPFPALTDGLIYRSEDGRPAPGAGILSPHDDLTFSDRPRKLDEISAGRFLVICTGFSPQSLLESVTLEALNALNAAFVSLGQEGLIDVNGRLRAFLDIQGWTSMIVRPDFYVYGGASDNETFKRVAESLINDLAECGVLLFSRSPSISEPK